MKTKYKLLTDCNTGECVERAFLCDNEKIKQLDKVIQQPIGSSSEDLLEDNTKVLLEKTKYQIRIIVLFSKYQSVWLKSKATQAMKYTEEFKVESPPVKMKVRLLAVELKKLNIQLNNMLKNGVISPLKSDWCDVP